MNIWRWLAAVFLCGAVAVLAEDKTEVPDLEKFKAARQKLVASLKPKQGKVDLHSGLATINVPPQYYFLGSDDTATVVYKLWGNPPSKAKPLGLLYPANEPLLGTNGWAVVFEYEEDGYVKDDDASTTDYTKMMEDMKAGAQKANKRRLDEGYPSVEIIGWAAPPHYDHDTHKLYWAKEIKFGDSDENTLNYDLRMLGRKGVLSLNVVAQMSRLKDVEAANPEILAMVDFNAGHRYTDFKPGSDKMATYGVAALVAGGFAAAKLGLFKGLLVALLAAKKLIIVAFVAVAGFIKKLFNGRRSNNVQ
ncbi:MAG TPA: DUF2167 domain-containing protein [Verrucomicrobiae bacterium]